MIVAHDFKDPEAPARRQQARPEHLERAKRFHESGNIIIGGPILDETDKSKMVGSIMLVDMPSKKKIQEWIDSDPYIKNRVWNNIEIYPYKLVDVAVPKK